MVNSTYPGDIYLPAHERIYLKIVERRDHLGKECYIVEKPDGSDFLSSLTNIYKNRRWYNASVLKKTISKPKYFHEL